MRAHLSSSSSLRWLFGIHPTFISLLCENDPETIDRAIELYRQYLGNDGIVENKACPGILEMVDRLKTKGSRMYIATAKPLIFAERILSHCGLDGYFQGMYGSDLKKPKYGERRANCFGSARVLHSGGSRSDGWR